MQDCSTIFFYENTKMIYCAIAKAAPVELREDFLNNPENIVIDSCNMTGLFILHVLGKCIITQS